MEKVRLISTDSHVNEPPETWERLPKEFREKGPRVVKDPPGLKGLYMVCEGIEPESVGVTFLAGKETNQYQNIIETFQWEDWRGPWDPNERVKDMDLDGVEVEVLFPSTARRIYGLHENYTMLQKAAFRAYNDWLHEYCSVAPKRLFGLALLSVLDVDWSIREVERCAKLGTFKGVVLPSSLPAGQSYSDPLFDPLWRTAQELSFPINFHVAMPQGRDRGRTAELKKGGVGILQRGRTRLSHIMEPQVNLVELACGGILERFPRLQIVFAEYELCWVLPIIQKMDSTVKRARAEARDGSGPSLLPSEYIRRQVRITFQQDRAGILALDIFGEENYMWASDYPHGGSVWPHSQEYVKSLFKGVSSNVQQKLAWENAAQLYRLH